MLASAGSAACGSVATGKDVLPDGGTTPESDAAVRADAPVSDAPHGLPLDAGIDTGPVVGCGGCGCGTPPNPTGSATPDQACQIAYGTSFGGDNGTPSACDMACAEPSGSNGGLYCTLPSAYTNAVAALADGGTGSASDASVDGGPCPAWSGNVVVQCGYVCLGRRTDGVPSPGACLGDDTGQAFVERAYLEAVSVHAFVRLEAELAAHRAPAHLRRRARKARRDEARHTSMMARLARRYGRVADSTPSPHDATVRSLFAIARENAVEGCIRETYGAVLGLVEARTSSDAEVRRAMRSIADDECRHAELSWDVAEWLLPRLTSRERREVALAAREAVEALAKEGDARIVRELEASVWSQMLAA